MTKVNVKDNDTKKSALKDRVLLIDHVNGKDSEVVEMLLKGKNVDANEKNSLGEFPAIAAAKNNDLDMLKILSKHGADLELKDAFGRTVEGWAKHHNNQKMLDFIKENVNNIILKGAEGPKA